MVESRYWLQTLGCPKNQVDSDKLEGRLAGQGYRRASAARPRPIWSWSTPAPSSSRPARSRSTPCWNWPTSAGPGPGWSSPDAWPSATGANSADALPEVDLVAGFGDRRSPSRPGVPVALARKPGPRPAPRVRPARAGPSGVRGSLGLREGGRGMRPHLRFLRHPVLPGQATLTPRGRGHGRGGAPAGRRDDAVPGRRRRRCARSCWWPRTWRPTAATARGRASG